jgi:hypothetical protein
MKLTTGYLREIGYIPFYCNTAHEPKKAQK